MLQSTVHWLVRACEEPFSRIGLKGVNQTRLRAPSKSCLIECYEVQVLVTSYHPPSRMVDVRCLRELLTLDGHRRAPRTPVSSHPS